MSLIDIIRDVGGSTAEVIAQLKAFIDNIEDEKVAAVNSLLVQVDKNAYTRHHIAPHSYNVINQCYIHGVKQLKTN